MQKDFPDMSPHVHVPYDSFDKYLTFIRTEKLNLELYFGSGSFDRLTNTDIMDLKEKLDYGPQLSIHGPFMDLSPGAVDSMVREVTIQRFSHVLDIAEILNPKVIVFHSGYDKWKYDAKVDIWLKGSLATWKPINERAAALGIKIAIENIFESEPKHLVLLAKEMNSDNFGLCFDTGHFNLFSELPLSEWIGMIKPYLLELHIHDNSRYADQHLAIGDGDFDFETLFKELEGVDCVYTIESHTVEDVKKSLKRIKEYKRMGQ